MQIQIKPEIRFDLRCPACVAVGPHPNHVLFLGMHTLADCHCGACGLNFYHTLPVGHALLFPVAFTRYPRQDYYPPRAGGWFAQPLLDSFFKHAPVEAALYKIVYRTCDQVILLNCLDNCYGHALLKLLNAQPCLDRLAATETGLVVIVPRFMRWLVPEGVAEVWSVDLPLRELNRWIQSFDSFVRTELERFSRVWICPANTHPDSTGIDLERFTRTKRFDLSRFYDQTPRVTFVCREDRFWLRYPWEGFIWRGCVKLRKTEWVRPWLVRRQNRLVARTSQLIARGLPGVRFTAVGLGRTGGFPPGIADRRTGAMTDELEKKWCRIYAESHLISGVHGSHLLLPTALAAGFVEILPRHKIDHLAEDVTLAYTNRYRPFLGRFLDEFASPRLVARHACSMIKNFPYWQLNTEEFLLKDETPEAIKDKYRSYLSTMGG